MDVVLTWALVGPIHYTAYFWGNWKSGSRNGNEKREMVVMLKYSILMQLKTGHNNTCSRAERERERERPCSCTITVGVTCPLSLHLHRVKMQAIGAQIVSCSLLASVPCSFSLICFGDWFPDRKFFNMWQPFPTFHSLFRFKFQRFPLACPYF